MKVKRVIQTVLRYIDFSLEFTVGFLKSIYCTLSVKLRFPRRYKLARTERDNGSGSGTVCQ